MDGLMEIFSSPAGDEAGPTALDVTVTILVTAVLSMVIGYTYRHAHRGALFAQRYVHALVLLSIITSVVIMVVGSNTARAFAVFGAFSMIRFRNALPETQDVGFIFFAMVVGMASGTGRHDMAALVTVLTCGVILVMRHLDLFPAVHSRRTLRVRVGTDDDYGAEVEKVLDRTTDDHELLTVESVQAGLLTELTYSVRVKRDSTAQGLVSEIQKVNGNNRILLLAQSAETVGRD
jgi:hypothetical protein